MLHDYFLGEKQNKERTILPAGQGEGEGKGVAPQLSPSN